MAAPTQRSVWLRQQLHFNKRRLALMVFARLRPACCRFPELRLRSPASCWYGSALAAAFRYPPTSGSSWSSVGLGCPPRKPGKRRFSWEPEGTRRGSEGGKIMACGSVKPLTKLLGLSPPPRPPLSFYSLSSMRGGSGGGWGVDSGGALPLKERVDLQASEKRTASLAATCVRQQWTRKVLPWKTREKHTQ